jgi:lipoprotein-anchoring transpeptidase ErfK/SrfK
MRTNAFRAFLYLVLPGLLLLASCAPSRVAPGELRLEVDISARELHVYRQDNRINTYPITVGKSTHPTPTGDFAIHRIDWNPDWNPPQSEWAEDESYTAPGHPDNPMGRVRMVYRAPYSIHGTEALESLGKAESHGSIRMANADIVDLAALLMQAGGAPKPSSWRDRVLSDPKKMVQVELPNPVPLKNKN